MKKSKLFMAAGGVLLAISAVFATKANKHFVAVSTAVAANASYNFTITNGSSVFTTAGSLPQAWAELCTSGASHHVVAGPVQLHTAVSNSQPVLFK